MKTAAPYSLRGKPGAPVSFPITWEELKDINHSQEITILNYQERLDARGDAWEGFYSKACPLHNKEDSAEIDPKIEEKLQVYMSKRNMDNTPEPGLGPVKKKGNRFCIQLHDAQNLHYDLRLEDEGVLLSWAIPKGLPHKKGVKRLAIQTEDHPLKYLSFEGVIPKGEYGAGSMWVFTSGTFEWIEKSEKKKKFKLFSKGFERSFSMYRTKDDTWLVELLENRDFSELKLPIAPMLAGVSKTIPSGDKYIFEIKWDGIRTIIHLEDEEVKIYSRSGRDISKQFPELLNPDIFDVESGIFDGEIVNLDEQGRPLISNVISRMHTTGDANIERVMKIFLDGKHIHNEPLIRRQAWLNTAIKKGKAYKMSEAITDGKGLFEASKAMNLEGIMAKDKNGTYKIGSRTDTWLKIKHRTTESCFIAGYTQGQGDRANLFGALHLLKTDESGHFRYMGKVGTGFDADKMKMLLEEFASYVSPTKTFADKTDDEHSSVWLKPELQCEIQYASLSSNGTYREPVFLQLLQD